MKIKSKGRTVSLMLRVSVAGRRSYLSPVFGKNHHLRPHFALVKGLPVHYPDASYSLRFSTLAGERVWEALGKDPQLAMTLFQARALRVAKEDAGFAVEAPRPTSMKAKALAAAALEDAGRKRLRETADAWVENANLRLSSRTAAAYKELVREFCVGCPRLYLQDIDRSDINHYIVQLRARGNGDRTIANRISQLRSMVTWAGHPELISGKDIPRYTLKTVSAYNADEVKAMMAVADEDQRLLLIFLTCSGLREGEVCHACYGDVDYSSGLIKVLDKPEWRFRIKDREERSIPLPDALLDALAARQQTHPRDRLIFPTAKGQPNGHLIRTIKALHHRAGLNCGQCTSGRSALSCRDHATCGKALLHKWRKSMATFLSESGVSVQSIQAMLGHSDLASTIRYLKIADLKSARTRSQVNNTFAAFAD